MDGQLSGPVSLVLVIVLAASVGFVTACLVALHTRKWK